MIFVLLGIIGFGLLASFGLAALLANGLVALAVAGFIVGALTNKVGLLGDGFLNFAAAVVVASIHDGIVSLGFSGLPNWLYIFLVWYFAGTFTMKLLALLPIPFVQEIAAEYS